MGLHETLLAPDRRAATVDGFVAFVEAEVAGKSGLGGAAVKTAYAAARKISPTIVRRAVAGMLPDFLDGLDPFWAARGEGAFSEALGSRPAEVTDALLSVTDRRAANPRHGALTKIYAAVRPRAARHVTDALPGLATTVERLMG
ncbi:MAG TPA: hypothetical protein VHM65_03810 [Candidatus Lustribacter sp.]|nr:hypothetical protein [Candidatus Lustribacter sp.]